MNEWLMVFIIVCIFNIFCYTLYNYLSIKRGLDNRVYREYLIGTTISAIVTFINYHSIYIVAGFVFFTALADLDISLTGHTYLWMIPVWSIGFFLLEYVGSYIKGWNICFRMIVYACVCFVVEYSFGMIFKYSIGNIPWDYSYSKWSINGAIRLDYFPFWCLAGVASEKAISVMKSVRVLKKDY